MNDRYIHFRNWERHQHYKRRNPVWIKVYIALLDDPSYRSLTLFNRALLHDLWLLSARMGNGRVPWSPGYLIDVLQIHADEADLGQLRDSHESGAGHPRDTLRKRVGRGLSRLETLGWLNQGDYVASASDSASTVASRGDSFASPETEGEEEIHVDNSEQELALYRIWRDLHGKRDHRYDVASVQRLAKIRARRKEFTDEQLAQALKAAAQDDWTERRKHNDLTVLFRSREKVDYWLERSPNGSNGNGPMMAANQHEWRSA